jgi:hypothetical protein
MKNRKGRGMTRSRDGRQLDVLLHDRIVGGLAQDLPRLLAH